MKTKIILLLLIIVSQSFYGQDYLDNGLYFSSKEVNQDQRTSLNLTPKSPLQLEDKWTIKFEANFRDKEGVYGNIFKIIGNEEFNIDLVSHLKQDSVNFWLVVKDTILFKYKWSDIPKGNFDKWMKFKLVIDSKNSSMTMSINGIKITKSYRGLKGLEEFDIIFGKSLYKNFPTTDVCSMSIKNIKILNKEDVVVRNWTLGKHTKDNKVYDNIIDDVAYVQNPKWLIDQHVFWKKEKNISFKNLLGTAKDEIRNRLFFIENGAIYIYDLENKKTDTIKFETNTLIKQSNHFIYNALKDELAAYSIEDKTYNTFDFEKLEWSRTDDAEGNETAYLHHNKIISPKDSTLIIYGGYGYYSYKSTIKHFDLSPLKVLRNYDLTKQITPRYLSSTGILNSNEFLIFGGYGSPSGQQGVNSQFYYDLYAVEFGSFKNPKVRKIWGFKNLSSTPYVPVQSMVVDKNSDSFYTLIYNNTVYNTHLKLARFGINEQKLTVYSDSIPYEFLDIKSNADFFLDSNKSKLNVLTTVENKVTLSTLTYPPLFATDIYQAEIKSNTSFNYIWILIILAVLVISFLIFKRIRKRKKISPKENTFHKQEIKEQPIVVKSEKIKKSAVYLFGGFQGFDDKGNDITALFTPTLKQLFIVILLSSIKNDKGISSHQLTELLWPNKNETKARNNRNVNISKLRLILEKIGDIEISNENTYWRMNVGASVFCDYCIVKNLSNISRTKNLSKEQIFEFINIVSSGEISPNIQAEWIEDFKTDISNLLIDDLDRISTSQNDPSVLILIGSTILKYAPLNETAISIKCKSLYAMGKKGTAKNSYDDFCKEYYEILDAKYDVTFKEIIS